jgi:hypothetical protein
VAGLEQERQSRPPAAADMPLSRRPFSSTMTDTLTRVIGRTSVTSRTLGPQDRDLLERGRDGGRHLHHPRSSARAWASISRSVSIFTGNAASAIGSASS